MDFLFKSPDSKLYGLTIFMAILLFQIGFVTVQWFFNRRNDFLFYIAYMFTTVLFGFSLYSEILVFPPFDLIPKGFFLKGQNMISILAVLLYYRFARSFLDLGLKRPKLNVKVKKLEYLLVAFLSLSILFFLDIIPEYVWIRFFIFMCLITIILSVFIIRSFLKNSSKLEKFAMLAASFLVVGSIFDVTLTLMEKANIEIPCDPHLPLLICVFAEILTFTSGLSYKTKALEVEFFKAENELLTRRSEIEYSKRELLEFKNKVAMDLHDDMGASLSLLNLSLQEYSAENSPEKKDKLVMKSQNLLTETIHHLKEMMKEIDNSFMPNEGYLNNLNTLARSIISLTGKNLIINHFNLEGFNNPKVEYQLYRITQELINNTLKHAYAVNIIIDIELKENTIYFYYEDDGVGFDINTTLLGRGLYNISRRVDSLKGSLNYETSVNSGFCCRIELPNRF